MAGASQAASGDASSARFRLQAVILDGAMTLAEADLAQAYAPFLGRDVSEADLTTITSSLGAAYRRAGYDLTRTIVPAQDLAEGRLRIRIIEGRIEDVVIVGDDADRFGLLRLLAPVTAETPARRSTLERQLLLANDRPGVRVTDTTLDEIVPASGRYRLKVSVKSWTIYGAIGLDNLGSSAVGPWQGSATMALNSMLVPGDSLVFAGSSSLGSWRELSFGSLAYDAPIGSDGFRIGAAATRSEIRPGDARRWTGTASQAETYEMRAWYAPLVSQSQTLWLGGALGISEIEERTNFGRTYRDDLGLLSLSADYKLHISESSWTYLFGTFRQGLGSTDGQSADIDLSRLGASTRFSLFNASAAHYQNLTDAWSIKLAAGGQIASGPLLVTQQYYLGGYSFGRGFEAGWISGDNAIAGSAELRYDIPLRMEYLNALQLYGFAEGGATETYFGPKSLVQKIASIGAGVRFFVTNDLLAGVAIAKPIADTAIYRKADGVAVLFSLTNSFHLCPGSEGWRCN
ncbi:ShlB/FhaC/HecB family hemolysin secretion/activation protein [Methylobacterium gnaphalii]|uniref:Heme utilization protein n=1 Tax=Methylobacterium gnaphalii TaxID=1010610 RepID=A0A512JGF0_9HYPH|nr:POTRA domain-containing protein [Methylobacterium gnaphalii]GEP09030.1 heme utilization protein [Methylobacterium gnaphalii]GJD71540.1 Heme/hemopexin transporter protein HuxB [Methylobacterium gnaphalii]GLS48953.1 heme utilization protein [Methylobacterium gnaphalii]